MRIASPAPKWLIKGPARSRAVALCALLLTVLALVAFQYREDASRLFRQARARALSTPQRVSLHVGFKGVQQLAADRGTSLKEGVRISGENTWVSASLHADGDELPAKIRLKGAFADHWEDPDKWSFSVNVKKENTYRGMKRFSIQRPETRENLLEWLFLKAVKQEGLIALRMDFAEVSMNGESLGMHALQERPAKRLIEQAERREGPLIRFNKDSWLHYRRQGVRPPPAASYEAAFVEANQSKSVRSSAKMAELYETATTMLEAFKGGERSTSEVFDVEAMARLAALQAVFGAYEFDWKDLSFYYNPLSARLEPIGKEIHPSKAPYKSGWWRGDERSPDREPFISQLFADAEFLRAYVRALARMSRQDYIDELLADHGAELAELTLVLQRDNPDYSFDDSGIREASRIVRRTLNQPVAVHAYLQSVDEEQVSIELASLHHFPLELVGLRVGNEPVVAPPMSTVLAGKREEDPLRFRVVHFDLPAGLAVADQDLGLELRLVGGPKLNDVRVPPWPRQAPAPSISHSAGTGDLQLLESLFHVDATGRRLTCREGQSSLATTAIIPRGFEVSCRGGVRWELSGGASLISFSALSLKGTKEEPIEIFSLEGSGGGIAVLGARERSELEHVQVSGLSAPAERGSGLTGAVTFYDTEVSIRDSTFSSNRRGDDNVNLFRTRFDMVDVAFRDSLADALDLDFCQGSIQSSSFHRQGNDAVDTSGSNIRARDLDIKDAGDKGMSFGEASRAVLDGIRIEGAKTGIASKDSSEVTVQNLEVLNGKIGLAAYQKKPEFGPGRLVVQGATLTGLKKPTDVERGSSIQVHD